MKKEAIITTLSITRAYEIKHFQVRIPGDASSICGVAVTVSSKGKTVLTIPDLPKGEVSKAAYNPSRYNRNLLFGDVLLFSCEEGNCFYTGELHEEDNNVMMGDFTGSTEDMFGQWSHGQRHEADEVIVDGDTTVVMGIYRDKVGKAVSKTDGYNVRVIIWIKTKN